MVNIIDHSHYIFTSTVDPCISEGNGTEPPLDMQNLRICKNMNIIEYHYCFACMQVLLR